MHPHPVLMRHQLLANTTNFGHLFTGTRVRIRRCWLRRGWTDDRWTLGRTLQRLSSIFIRLEHDGRSSFPVFLLFPSTVFSALLSPNMSARTRRFVFRRRRCAASNQSVCEGLVRALTHIRNNQTSIAADTTTTAADIDLEGGRSEWVRLLARLVSLRYVVLSHSFCPFTSSLPPVLVRRSSLLLQLLLICRKGKRCFSVIRHSGRKSHLFLLRGGAWREVPHRHFLLL